MKQSQEKKDNNNLSLSASSSTPRVVESDHDLDQEPDQDQDLEESESEDRVEELLSGAHEEGIDDPQDLEEDEEDEDEDQMEAKSESFREQIAMIGNWFEREWNEVEQTVALFSLIKKIKSRKQKTFLYHVLSYSNVQQEGEEGMEEEKKREKEANSLTFLQNSYLDHHQNQPERLVSLLLSHLPLLDPITASPHLKQCYIQMISSSITTSLASSSLPCFSSSSESQVDACRQLLSYSLIHPAFDVVQKKTLNGYCFLLEQSLQGNSKENCQDLVNQNNRNVFSQMGNNREHQAYLQSSVGSCFEVPAYSSPGMEGVPSWLKSLRLHKYTPLFKSMSYSEFLALTEDQLEDMKMEEKEMSTGVVKKITLTTGARKKLLTNVHKLNQRSTTIYSLFSSINEKKQVIQGIKQILGTPLKGGDEVPALIVSILIKLKDRLKTEGVDEEERGEFLSLLEKCLNSKSFSPAEKATLTRLKQEEDEARKRMRPLKGKLFPPPPVCCSSASLLHSSLAANIIQPYLTSSLLDPRRRPSEQELSQNKRPSSSGQLQERVYRTLSAPIPSYSSQFAVPLNNNNLLNNQCNYQLNQDQDPLNNQMENLCLQMTEKALLP